MNKLYLIGVISSMFILMVNGSPIFNLLFGNTHSGGYNNYGRRPRGRSFSSEGGYNEYRRICRTINPDPYAFIGSNPYPAVPVCP